ncbi:MAG: hypothetical protein Q9162_000158 [Coniocarpon cinnabarinum]
MAPILLLHQFAKRDESGHTGMIVGITMASLAVLMGLLCILFCCIKYNKRGSGPRSGSLPNAGSNSAANAFFSWLTRCRPTRFGSRNASGTLPTAVQQSHSNTSITPLQTLNRTGRNSGGIGNNYDGTTNQRASVRSIMTLPSYSADAREHEEIIGREGERAGMDAVIEFPEDESEEEARREADMLGMFQIRTRRREERDAREERRTRRREARARNDRDALEALRRESQRARQGSPSRPTAAQMLDQHRKNQRGRRFASVDYGALGVARHDGSRIRANSTGSDRPLLPEAAAIAGHPGLNTTDLGALPPPLPYSASDISVNSIGNHSGQSSPGITIVANTDGPESGASAVQAPCLAYSPFYNPAVASQNVQQIDSVHVATLADATPSGPPTDSISAINVTIDPAGSQVGASAHPQDNEHKKSVHMPAFAGSPFYNTVSAEAPQLPSLALVPSIEITPFTPAEEHEDGGDQAWPL